MNYFIPDWTSSSGNLESDYMMNVIQLFKNNREPYHLLLLEHIPFLRYKMHAYGLEAAQMTSALRSLARYSQDQWVSFLDVDDLPLSLTMWRKVYTPFGITLIKEDQPFGEIRFNAFWLCGTNVFNDGPLPTNSSSSMIGDLFLQNHCRQTMGNK